MEKPGRRKINFNFQPSIFNYVAICCMLLMVSCGDKNIVDERHTFDGDRWNRFSPEQFNFSVGNIENYYNIDITAAVDTALYRYSELPLMLILEAPGGEERQFYGTVLFKDNDRWRGQIKDGYRTASGRIRSYFSFNNKGTHHLRVSQATSQYDLEGIHSVTLNVTRAKVDYDL